MSAKKKEQAVAFEGAMQELNAILDKLSSEEVTLEETVELYAAATEKIAACDKALKAAQLRIETIDEALARALREEEDDV